MSRDSESVRARKGFDGALRTVIGVTAGDADAGWRRSLR